MKCPFCHHADTQVIDSRITEEGDAIRRRRKCSACERRFTTYERADLSLPVVAKRNGTRMDFDPARLRAGMGGALRKRSIPMSQADAPVPRIDAKLHLTGQPERLSETIGELVMAELKQLDQVAYVRFASVYKRFKDIREFVEAIDAMNDPDRG